MLQIFIDLKEAYDSFGREVLCNILIQFGFLLEMIRLIKLCLNETYSRVTVGKYLYDLFPTKNGLKNKYVLSTFLFRFTLEYAIR